MRGACVRGCEELEAWQLFGSSPLYTALTKAYAAGVPGEYLRALSYTFDEEEWYLAQRLVSYSPVVYQAVNPVSQARTMVCGGTCE